MRTFILLLAWLAYSTLASAETVAPTAAEQAPQPSTEPAHPQSPPQSRAGDMRSDVAGALAKPAPTRSAVKELPPDFLVLHALLTTASRLNFRTRGRGHDYLHKAIGFSNKGALALMAYNRRFEKLRPPDDTSLHEALCPHAAEFTSSDEIASVATAVDNADWGRWSGFVAGAYEVLDGADAAVMRKFLEPRSKPASAFQRVNWYDALATMDAKDFLVRFCDPGRKVCRAEFNRNYEVVPGENCGTKHDASEKAVVFDRQPVCSDSPTDRRIGLIPPCRDVPVRQ